MTTERSVRERFAIRVLRSADCALRSTDGELVRGLSTEVRPTTDLHLLDSERMTGNTKVGLKSPGLPATTIRANRAMGKINTNDGTGDRYHVPLSSVPLSTPLSSPSLAEQRVIDRTSDEIDIPAIHLADYQF
jgi:hypothetical protein